MARRGSYPHPVIDAADDVASDFEVLNILVEPTQHDIEVTYEVRTDDPDLVTLLDAGMAMHSLRWKCSSTISTGEMEPVVHKTTATGYVLQAWLDQALVRGDITADVRVIVAQPLASHSWERQHADYEDATFDLKVGDVLAEGGALAFSAEKLYDPLDPPVGSCFRFHRSTSGSHHRGIKVTFDSDDAVDVRIPAKTFDEFKLLGHRSDLQIALVVLPALMDTLRFIKENREVEPLDDKVWFTAIDALVEGKGGWGEPPLVLAQKVLDNPIDLTIRRGLTVEEED